MAAILSGDILKSLEWKLLYFEKIFDKFGAIYFHD